jgi:hypothetical protein
MKKGELCSVTDYVIVDRVMGDQVDVTNVDSGLEFKIQGRELLEELKSADSFNSSKKVTKTELAEKLVSCYNVAFTVRFEKTNGEERTLRGRLQSHEPLMGRSYVEDLDIPKDQHRLRLVDHRTLKYLIVDGVKYYV